MIPELGSKKRRRQGASRMIFLVVPLFTLFFSCFFPAAAFAEEFAGPEQIVLTWTLDPATSQTITWLMPDDGPAWVQYVMAEGFDGCFDAARQMEAVGAAFAGAHYRYTVTITGLNPDTQYVYRVGRDGAWSEPLSFSTSSADPEDFTFLYLGDVQSGYTQWGSMLEAIYQENPQIRFALLGGDLTENGDDKEEWGEFLDAATRLFSRIPVMPTMGNHDGAMYLEFFALPDNGPAGLKQEFYSFDYGDAHFAVLNSNKNTNETAKQWLQEDLQNTAKKWKFAVFHHPAYPASCDYKGIDKSICENWIPILEQSNVDMVFVGHQHVYMRTHPLYWGEVQSDAYGIVYVMGNSGSRAYAAGGGFPYIAREETGSNYQVIDLKGDVLTLTAKKEGGELIETYTISKGKTPGPGRDPLYTVTPESDPAYTPGSTEDGIRTMTVNPGITGFKYFTVSIMPLIPHSGTETVVFTHLRNGSQLELNATRADFDQVDTARAGFNVQPGDTVKVYMVDDLTGAVDCNPIILQ